MIIEVMIKNLYLKRHKPGDKMIKSVKIQGNGYLVNNEMSVPNDSNNRHYIEIQEWLKTNTPEPEFTIVELQTKKIQELDIVYNNANQLDIAYMSTTFQADKASQDLIVKVLSAGSVPTGFFWIDKVNNQVSMTDTQLQGLSGAILIRNQVNFIKFQGLKAKVKLAKTQAELDKVIW